jgi:predicted DNA-binding protein with PD1-like motif
MKSMRHAGAMEVVVLALGPGEMLLESIRQAIAKEGIRNAAVVSGVGTLKTCRMHYIRHTDFPPADEFFTLAKPLELLSVSGVIADGQPHLHVVVSHADREVYAGHLEDGSEVAYLAELAILVFNDLALARRPDPTRKVNLLGPK